MLDGRLVKIHAGKQFQKTFRVASGNSVTTSSLAEFSLPELSPTPIVFAVLEAAGEGEVDNGRIPNLLGCNYLHDTFLDMGGLCLWSKDSEGKPARKIGLERAPNGHVVAKIAVADKPLER
jgi:hypothetical protein